MENVNSIVRILKRQNEVKNDMLRLKTLHKVQGPSVISYEKVGRPESIDNFEQIHDKFNLLFDTVSLKVDSIIYLDSMVSLRSKFSLREPATLILRTLMRKSFVYNTIYHSMFDSIVQTRNNPRDVKARLVENWRNELNDADFNLSSALDSSELIIDEQTNQRIRDIDARVISIRQITLFIIGAVTLFALIFGFFFSRAITDSLRRLKETAGTIGKGDFSMNPSGYPNDEIGDLASAFFQMAVNLKQTQEELIKSKRLAAIGEIVASVNHEINNPLMIISGNAQFLEMTMEGYPEEMKNRVRTILEETERISSVTRKLREIKNPIVEDYTSSGEQMINLDKSSL